MLSHLPRVSNALLVDIVRLIDDHLVWGAIAVTTYASLLKAVLRAVHDIMATHESGVELLDQLVAFCNPELLKTSVTSQDIVDSRLAVVCLSKTASIARNAQSTLGRLLIVKKDLVRRLFRSLSLTLQLFISVRLSLTHALSLHGASGSFGVRLCSLARERETPTCLTHGLRTTVGRGEDEKDTRWPCSYIC